MRGDGWRRTGRNTEAGTVSLIFRGDRFELTAPINLQRPFLKDAMMPEEKSFKVAILWRGDLAARKAATPQNNRFHRIFEELAAVGIRAEPAVYHEDFADEVGEQLLGADGVLVWVDPIHQGKTREALDPLLRDVASRGPWVSAHPDVILKMGVKEVLYCTKHLGWGADTHLYRDVAEFCQAFPTQLNNGPRVL